MAGLYEPRTFSSSELPEGFELARLLPDYAVDEIIGTGSTGVVKKAIDKRTEKLVAIKIIPLLDIGGNAMSQDIVTKEVELLKMLECPQIIKLYDVVYTNAYACLVLEYASNGDFFTYLTTKTKPLSEDEARPFFKQLISGVAHMHRMMVAHRDLKLENLLVDENFNLKISDFGLSAIMNKTYLLRECCGSPHYAAPEVLSVEPYYGPQVDVWACGVILFASVCGLFPFEDENPLELYHKIKEGKFEFPKDIDISDEYRDLVTRMLTVCPLTRMTITRVLQHPWLRA